MTGYSSLRETATQLVRKALDAKIEKIDGAFLSNEEATEAVVEFLVTAPDCFECNTPLHGPFCPACNPDLAARAAAPAPASTREQIARIIDPEAWEEYLLEDGRVDEEVASIFRDAYEASLAKADAILARLATPPATETPGGGEPWNKSYETEDEHAAINRVLNGLGGYQAVFNAMAAGVHRYPTSLGISPMMLAASLLKKTPDLFSTPAPVQPDAVSGEAVAWVKALIGKHLGPHLGISPTSRYEAVINNFCREALAAAPSPPVSEEVEK